MRASPLAAPKSVRSGPQVRTNGRRQRPPATRTTQRGVTECARGCDPAASRSHGEPFVAMRTRDGRSIGVLEVGRTAGVPVLFSWQRLLAVRGLVVAGAAENTGVRLIALGRAGVRCSDPCRRDRLLDWPEKVVAVVDASRWPCLDGEHACRGDLCHLTQAHTTALSSSSAGPRTLNRRIGAEGLRIP